MAIESTVTLRECLSHLQNVSRFIHFASYHPSPEEAIKKTGVRAAFSSFINQLNDGFIDQAPASQFLGSNARQTVKAIYQYISELSSFDEELTDTVVRLAGHSQDALYMYVQALDSYRKNPTQERLETFLSQLERKQTTQPETIRALEARALLAGRL